MYLITISRRGGEGKIELEWIIGGRGGGGVSVCFVNVYVYK